MWFEKESVVWGLVVLTQGCGLQAEGECGSEMCDVDLRCTTKHRHIVRVFPSFFVYPLKCSCSVLRVPEACTVVLHYSCT